MMMMMMMDEDKTDKVGETEGKKTYDIKAVKLLSLSIVLAALIIAFAIILVSGPMGGDVETGSGAPQQQGQHVAEPIASIKIFANETLFRAKKVYNISVVADSTGDWGNGTLTVNGIRAKSQDYLEERRIVELKDGEQEFIFPFRTPSCYGCQGIDEGFYNITAKLMRGGETISESVFTVEVRA